MQVEKLRSRLSLAERADDSSERNIALDLARDYAQGGYMPQYNVYRVKRATLPATAQAYGDEATYRAEGAGASAAAAAPAEEPGVVWSILVRRVRCSGRG